MQVPKYKYIYSYPTEFGDFLEGNRKEAKRPSHLGIDIFLPGVVRYKLILKKFYSYNADYEAILRRA